MNKNACSIAIAILFCQPAFAQFYVGANGSWLFPFVSVPIGNNAIFTNSVYTGNVVNGSYGSGITGGGLVGYGFTENISAEVRMNYLFADEATFNFQELRTNANDNAVTKRKMNITNIVPSICYSLPGKEFTPYMRIGLLIGMASMNETNTVTRTSSVSPTSITDSVLTYEGNIAWGGTASIGMKIKIKKNIQFFAEFVMNHQIYKPAKSTVISYSENGMNKLGSLNTSQKQTEYSDNVSSISSQDLNESSKQPTMALYASSMGLQAGLIWRFDHSLKHSKVVR